MGAGQYHHQIVVARTLRRTNGVHVLVGAVDIVGNPRISRPIRVDARLISKSPFYEWNSIRIPDVHQMITLVSHKDSVQESNYIIRGMAGCFVNRRVPPLFIDLPVLVIIVVM